MKDVIHINLSHDRLMVSTLGTSSVKPKVVVQISARTDE